MDLKILIIGYGSIAKKHINAILKIHPTANFIALRSSKKSENLLHIHSIYNYEEIKENLPLDFIIISNPTYKHEETVIKLLEFKIPIFIEKPIFHRIVKNEVLNKINESKILTYVGCNLRFLDSIIYFKENILSNLKVNEVNVYCGSYLPDWRPSDYKKNYSFDSQLGGGVHLDLIHEIDYIYWLFSSPQSIVSIKTSKSTLKLNSIDYANYQLEYDRFNVNIVLNYFRRDRKRTLEFVCSDETFLIDILNNNIKTLSNNNIIYQSSQTIIDTFQNQILYFLNSINKHKVDKEYKIMNSANEGYEVLKICLHDFKK